MYLFEKKYIIKENNWPIVEGKAMWMEKMQ